MGSKSKSSSSTSSRQYVDTTNVNQQLDHIEGPVIFGDGDVTEIDPGSFVLAGDALDFAGDANRDALDFARDVNRDAFDLGAESLATVEASNILAFDFGSDALNAVIDNQRDAGDLIAGIVGDSYSLVDSAIGDAIGEVSDSNKRALAAVTDQVDRTVMGLQSFALEQSESSADQVTEFGKIALLAVAAILVLPSIFKG